MMRLGGQGTRQPRVLREAVASADAQTIARLVWYSRGVTTARPGSMYTFTSLRMPMRPGM